MLRTQLFASEKEQAVTYSMARPKKNCLACLTMKKDNQNQPKNQPKIVPRSAPSQSKIGSGTDIAFETLFGTILVPFWSQLGAILGVQIGPCWGHVGQKIDFLSFKKALKNDHDFQHL